MQTDTTWPATRLHLDSIRQEYDILCQEFNSTSDPERRARLRQWAAVCVREFETVMQAWRDQTVKRE